MQEPLVSTDTLLVQNFSAMAVIHTPPSLHIQLRTVFWYILWTESIQCHELH